MTSAKFSTSLEAQQAAALLKSYRFELGDHDARQWVSLWLEFYKPSWIRDAVVEALYQGRYKSVSVRQILDLWQRRSKPIRHVTHEFEAAVCREFGEVKIKPARPSAATGRQSLNGQSSNGQSSNGQSSNGQSSNGQSSNGQPTTGRVDAIQSIRHSTLSKRANAASAVSFNLAELAASPGMEPLDISLAQRDPSGTQSVSPVSTASSTQTLNRHSQQQPSHQSDSNAQIDPSADVTGQQATSLSTKRNRPLDNKAWREFANYTTPTHAPKPPDPEETLRIQRQFNGVLYSSARAIQPFKPALPFSAKTLSRAKQKALAESL